MSEPGPPNIPDPVIFFDGVCPFCTGSARLLIRVDRRAIFKLAALQSEKGKSVLAAHGLDSQDYDSIVLIENGKLYQRSSAILRILFLLGWPWRAATIISIVPAFLLDIFYNCFARNRFRLFGRADTCYVPSLKERERFLESF
ncbi:MAG: thiol-disulfide oxidoreductase DCC family protein [Oligoflexia bacterium]|nr:thiol-disulfide oxidoreductase DCC family protein [Oligoflexia bacterium]